MKTKKLINKGIWGLIGLLGFNTVASCDDDDLERTYSKPVQSGRRVVSNDSTEHEPTPSDTTTPIEPIKEDTLVLIEDTAVVCMYGVPTANYIFKGKVTDAKGLPIEKAQLQFFNCGREMAVISTDTEGAYSFQQTDFPCDITISVSADQYASKDTTITLEGQKFEGGDGAFFYGDADIETDIQLKNKKRR